MGMTRAVGLGFLLLLVVSLATEQSGGGEISEAQKRQARLDNLLPNEHHLDETVTETTINDVNVGDKVFFVLDGKSTLSDGSLVTYTWILDKNDWSEKLRIGGLQEIFTSQDDSVSNLYRVEVVPMKSGSQMFSIRRTDGTAKTVTFSASQGSTLFLLALENVSTGETIQMNPGTVLTVYLEYWSNEYNWEITRSVGVTTTAIIEATQFENNVDYNLPLKTFNVTPTGTGLPFVTLKLKKLADNSVSATYNIMDLNSLSEYR